MPTTADKADSDYEYSAERLQEIENKSNAIKNHAKWVLSLLAAIALGLASFVFRDLGELPIIYEGTDETAQFIKLFAGFLLIFHSLLILAFIPWLLWEAKISANNEAKGLRVRIEEGYKRLVVIDKRFRRLIRFFIASPFLSAGIATYFTYFA